eukprot:6528076-Lingulodinium_polyedra.AAC.1
MRLMRVLGPSVHNQPVAISVLADGNEGGPGPAVHSTGGEELETSDCIPPQRQLPHLLLGLLLHH